MTDEQKYHRNSDGDCLTDIANVLCQVRTLVKANPELAKLLWPHMMPTWLKVEAERLIEIRERWIDGAQ